MVIATDIVLDVRIENKTFKARDLFPGIFPEKSLVPCINFPETMLLNYGPLLVGSFPYVRSRKFFIKFDQ